MSVLCKDWTPTLSDRETVASMPLDKELNLSLSLRAGSFGARPRDPRVLLLSANVDDVSLFELRFWDGRLRLNAGTGGGQESNLVLGADSFDFQVSFNPQQGGLAIVASWVMLSGERLTHSFAANISNLKLPRANYYTLRLGAPKHYVDHTLLGWRVNAAFDLAEPASKFTARLMEFAPTEAPPAIAETSPFDALRLALQSIDSWRKVAEDALGELEGGAR